MPCRSFLGTRRQEAIRGDGEDTRTHGLSNWHWASNRPLALPLLRSVLATLPEGIYRAKGILCFEELPAARYVLQMVGRRYTLAADGLWGDERPRSEIVVIGARDGIDGDALQCDFDTCIGTGDELGSPILRLARRLVQEAT